MPDNATSANDSATVWLTVTEAARRLGANDKTVRRWIETGLLPGTIRLSPQRKSEYRIPLKAIEQFEESRKIL